MNRCLSLTPRRHALRWLPALVLGGLAVTSAFAQSQTPRTFPTSALRGTMVVTAPPEIVMDGVSARLSPGARIRNQQNTMVLSGMLLGQELVVNYTRESHGLVHEVWILTDAEIAQERATASRGRNFLFGSEVTP